MARAMDPVLVVDLFPELRRAGVELLGSLTSDEWSLPTSNPGWSVHDVALHLVGGLLANVSRDAGPRIQTDGDADLGTSVLNLVAILA